MWECTCKFWKQLQTVGYLISVIHYILIYQKDKKLKLLSVTADMTKQNKIKLTHVDKIFDKFWLIRDK